MRTYWVVSSAENWGVILNSLTRSTVSFDVDFLIDFDPLLMSQKDLHATLMFWFEGTIRLKWKRAVWSWHKDFGHEFRLKRLISGGVFISVGSEDVEPFFDQDGEILTIRLPHNVGCQLSR